MVRWRRKETKEGKLGIGNEVTPVSRSPEEADPDRVCVLMNEMPMEPSRKVEVKVGVVVFRSGASCF